MGKKTNISWCHHTFNHVIGCDPVSPGCKNCYAKYETPVRAMKIGWGPDEPRYRTTEAYWRQPLLWDRAAAKTGLKETVFCDSLSDWLLPNIPAKDTADLLTLIYSTPSLIWLLLTKRIENFKPVMLAAVKELERRSDAEPLGVPARVLMWLRDWLVGRAGTHFAPSNIWLGVTVENSDYLERYYRLAEIAARVRFISHEPALDSMDWLGFLIKCRGLGIPLPDWIIYGGESGDLTGKRKPKPRPASMHWAADLLIACKGTTVAPFIKQLGSDVYKVRLGRKIPVRFKDKKGGDMGEWPKGFRVRQMPGTQV